MQGRIQNNETNNKKIHIIIYIKSNSSRAATTKTKNKKNENKLKSKNGEAKDDAQGKRNE